MFIQLFDLTRCVDIRWMDAIQSGSIQNSSGLLLTECEQRDAIKENTHFCSGVFSKANNVFVCSETAFFFPTVRGRRNSSKLFRFEPGSAFHPTPLMFDRIDAKIMLITETFLNWTAIDVSVWFCGFTHLTFVKLILACQTYSCNTQERAFHSYHVRGMTYLKKAFFMCQDTLFPEKKRRYFCLFR